MDSFQIKTPVCFFVFNRPDTTSRVFEEIRHARPPQLLVVADGPRVDRPGEAEKCDAVRAIVEQIDWPCEVLKNYSDTNLGCKRRVSSGLDWVFSQVDEAIILEDDCLPHSSFFTFCDNLLERYRDDTRIMMIAGSNFLAKEIHSETSYFFSRYFPIWGWATWRRAWAKYDISMKDWPSLRRDQQISAMYIQESMRTHMANAFDLTYQGSIETWDYQWFYSCLFNNGLAIMPKVNLISNIGIVGTHSETYGMNHLLPITYLETERIIHPELVHPNFVYDNRFFEVNFGQKSQANCFFQKAWACLSAAKKLLQQLRGFARHYINITRTGYNEKKTRPEDYSATLGRGSIVPCQIEAYFLALNKYVAEGANVLDVGFGLGYGLNILAIKAGTVSGIDVDSKAYMYCQETVVGRNPKLGHLSIYGGYNIDFPDSYFDVVTCVDVLEHVEDYHRFLRELLRVSRKGVFISTPNRRPEYTNPDGTPKNYWHLREWSFGELEVILQQHGKTEWNFLNGPFEGPFSQSKEECFDTIALSPFIHKMI
jgi:2-polyprenyl-3-methyl-5-hydroxy-6-metoxy-1,4-benzoquinol methylase